MSAIKLDDTYEPRPWSCEECNHLLGVVMRDTQRIRRLWVFANYMECLPSMPVLLHPPRGLFKIHGIDQCHGVECPSCGALNGWTMSKESYLRLVSYYQKSP